MHLVCTTGHFVTGTLQVPYHFRHLKFSLLTLCALKLLYYYYYY